LNAHRASPAIRYDKEIYHTDYWQKKVDALIREKKNILKVTEQTHKEIRKASE
jgi:hypothetical protein